jgi:UDP-N-acetylglucosamine--N-acetylmuramyl-(pentapeptide) pyrophosphoryl-undecaprenol N-acetylglucosamine transferase
LDEKFQVEFAELLENDDKRKALGNEIRALAKVDATKAIVDEIEKLLNV